MHEASLIRGLISKIEEIASENQAQKVTVVRIQLGALSHCSPEHFREHYVDAAKGTIAEHAKLEIEELPSGVNNPNAQEIILDSIEVEE